MIKDGYFKFQIWVTIWKPGNSLIQWLDVHGNAPCLLSSYHCHRFNDLYQMCPSWGTVPPHCLYWLFGTWEGSHVHTGKHTCTHTQRGLATMTGPIETNLLLEIIGQVRHDLGKAKTYRSKVTRLFVMSLKHWWSPCNVLILNWGLDFTRVGGWEDGSNLQKSTKQLATNLL